MVALSRVRARFYLQHRNGLSGRGSSKVLTLGKLGFRSAQLAGER